jgi:hypothetical protein
VKIHWNIASQRGYWSHYGACGAFTVGSRFMTTDPEKVTCLSCRRNPSFSPYQTELDRLQERARTKMQHPWIWERLSVDMDKYLVEHGECEASRRLAAKVMAKTRAARYVASL